MTSITTLLQSKSFAACSKIQMDFLAYSQSFSHFAKFFPFSNRFWSMPNFINRFPSTLSIASLNKTNNIVDFTYSSEAWPLKQNIFLTRFDNIDAHQLELAIIFYVGLTTMHQTLSNAPCTSSQSLDHYNGYVLMASCTAVAADYKRKYARCHTFCAKDDLYVPSQISSSLLCKHMLIYIWRV